MAQSGGSNWLPECRGRRRLKESPGYFIMRKVIELAFCRYALTDLKRARVFEGVVGLKLITGDTNADAAQKVVKAVKK